MSLKHPRGIVITDPEQIPKLPWGGNFAADADLHEAVSEYVRREADPYKAYRAEYHANWHGCGERIRETPNVDDLEYVRTCHQDYLNELREKETNQ